METALSRRIFDLSNKRNMKTQYIIHRQSWVLALIAIKSNPTIMESFEDQPFIDPTTPRKPLTRDQRLGMANLSKSHDFQYWFFHPGDFFLWLYCTDRSMTKKEYRKHSSYYRSQQKF